MTIDELKTKCEGCHLCPLGETRTNLVFGTGNANSPIMFVGEAPGEQEDKSGIPFVGRAGQLFDKYLEAVGIERSDVYICNILKCRPPKNRDPLPEEQEKCMDHLRDQVRIIKPKLIVCLGRIAAMKLIGEDFHISTDHGKWYKKGNFEICAVYHPSFLLRNPAGKKEEMLTDMQMIAKRLEALADV